MGLTEERKVIAVMRGGKPVLENNLDQILYGTPSMTLTEAPNKKVVKIILNGVEKTAEEVKKSSEEPSVYGSMLETVLASAGISGRKAVKAYKGGEEIKIPEHIQHSSMLYGSSNLANSRNNNTLYIEAIFDVLTVGVPINVLGNSNSMNLANIDSMYVDGRQIEPTKLCKFNSTGQHVVKIGLVNSEEIPAYMFYKCIYLSTVKIPNGIQNVCKYAFYGCSILNNLSFPESVLTIEDNVFHNCSSLTNITLSPNIITIGEKTFRYCINLKEIILPKCLTYISRNLFHGCTNLLSIKIPENVEFIEYEAFSRCSNLSVVFLPKSLKQFNIKQDTDNKYSGVFYACTKLNTIYCPCDNVNDITKYIFQDIKSNGVLHVKKGTCNLYKQWMKKQEYYLGYYNWTIQEDL